MRKFGIIAFLLSLVLGTIGIGLYYEHYFVVMVFGVWICVEFLVWGNSFQKGVGSVWTVPGALGLLRLFRDDTATSDRLILEEITQLMARHALSHQQHKWLERLRVLVELRRLHREGQLNGTWQLRQAFLYTFVPDKSVTRSDSHVSLLHSHIADSASFVADMYWKLYDTATGNYPQLTPVAKKLMATLLSHSNSDLEGVQLLERAMDRMHREGGVSFLILNLIRQGQLDWARTISRRLLTDAEDLVLDEDVRSALYWVSEMHGFKKDEVLSDYESSIRHLYHVCFTDPARASFLEIDSQFFSQFETVNELAREGFLFKEVLFEKILNLWQEYEGLFDPVFQSVLEMMTGQKSKIYDDSSYWKRYWEKAQDHFCREYLYVVEGNLCYARGHYRDAIVYYEKALALVPDLRPALLNLPFCYAQLGDTVGHEQSVQNLGKYSELFPSAYYVSGNSYLLLGEEEKSEACYESLRGVEGWENKGAYYRSTFCFEHKLYAQALRFAEKAYEKNPHDVAVRYHLSLCYNAVGEKEKALEMVKKVGTGPEWLNYYRFTLERDAGRFGEASQTLMSLPTEYFEDPEELNAAVDFAHLRRDLVLLRHLRRKP